MLKLNKSYSDYVDMDDANNPLGKAVNSSSSDSYDGTPILADLVNDLNAAHIAMYAKAHGNTTGITGNPDNQNNSQFADAVEKLIDDTLEEHTDLTGTDVHGATADATSNQIICRDENGRAKVASPVEDLDIANKNYIDTKIGNLDVDSVGGTGKVITTISETDGKISATSVDIATTVASGNSNPVTSGAVKSYVDDEWIYVDYNFTVSLDASTGLEPNKNFKIANIIKNGYKPIESILFIKTPLAVLNCSFSCRFFEEAEIHATGMNFLNSSLTVEGYARVLYKKI